MTEADDELPRLISSGSADARDLLRSARLDAPSTAAQEAGMANVISSYRSRQRGAWFFVGAAVAAGLVVGFVSFLRPSPAVISLAREPRVESSSTSAVRAIVRGAPSAVAPAEPSKGDALEPCAPAARSAGDAPMIDDFEDGDGRILHVDRRAGSWSTFNDTTGSQRPSMGGVVHTDRIPGGRGSSHFAIHTSGSKFTKWGASLSVELSPRRCYDASAYGGIAFWARGHGKINAIVKMTQVVAEEFGGSCLHDCYDGHRATIALSKNWELYRVRWEDLAQAGFGATLAFDARSLFAIEFQVLAEETPFDFWIDDLTFIER